MKNLAPIVGMVTTFCFMFLLFQIADTIIDKIIYSLCGFFAGFNIGLLLLIYEHTK